MATAGGHGGKIPGRAQLLHQLHHLLHCREAVQSNPGWSVPNKDWSGAILVFSFTGKNYDSTRSHKRKTRPIPVRSCEARVRDCRIKEPHILGLLIIVIFYFILFHFIIFFILFLFYFIF